MNRTLLWTVILLLCVSSGYALEVDVQELEENIDDRIRFTSYEGEHAYINTAEQITGIGRTLSTLLESSGGMSAGIQGKYTILHAVDSSVDDGLDADIISFGRNAEVDHIDNVRRIVSGYLQSAYGYSAEDAALLAEFITIYNAVFRGRMDHVSDAYKQVVLDNVSDQEVGLSTEYTDWAGE